MLGLCWGIARQAGAALPPLSNHAGNDQPLLVMGALSAQALLSLVAMSASACASARAATTSTAGSASARRSRSSPARTTSSRRCFGRYVSQGDFLRLLAYGVLLVGVWRAIRFAEFGRAVAEERARVAREIHDGLAQYLFAVSTHAAMLEAGADLEKTLPQLKEAAAAAQQEARFAVLALSSAAGTRTVRLGPAPVRRLPHRRRRGSRSTWRSTARSASRPTSRSRSSASSRRGSPTPASTQGPGGPRCAIEERAGERFVTVVDDGSGFDERRSRPGRA